MSKHFTGNNKNNDVYTSKLYARDVLNGKELGILFEHFKDDEITYFENNPDYEVYESITIGFMAIDVANSIINNEPLDSLWGYDLWHVLSYKDEYRYIVDKIERALEDEKRHKGVIYSYGSLREFGYTYFGMVGFDKKVAVELFYNTNISVYGLREDGSESLIECIDDMEDFEVFGSDSIRTMLKTLLGKLTDDKIVVE